MLDKEVMFWGRLGRLMMRFVCVKCEQQQHTVGKNPPLVG